MPQSISQMNKTQKGSLRPGVEVIPGLKLRCLCIGHTDSVTVVAWSPDGDLLASSSRDQTVRVWDPKTGNCRNTVPVKDSESIVPWLSSYQTMLLLYNLQS